MVDISRIHDLEFPHSLGTFYESVTSALGLKPSRHEGKIVGLAAYAVHVATRPRFLLLENGDFFLTEEGDRLIL